MATPWLGTSPNTRSSLPSLLKSATAMLVGKLAVPWLLGLANVPSLLPNNIQTPEEAEAAKSRLPSLLKSPTTKDEVLAAEARDTREAAVKVPSPLPRKRTIVLLLIVTISGLLSL